MRHDGILLPAYHQVLQWFSSISSTNRYMICVKKISINEPTPIYICIYIYIYCEFHSSSCLFASCQVHISHVLAVQAQDPSGGREWNQTIALCRWARHRCGRISWSIYFHQEVDIPFRVRGPIKQSKGIGRIGFLLPV